MKIPTPPKPPPCRLMRGYEQVNEYELVDWYTDLGEKYKDVVTEINWFDKIFMPEHKRKLLKSLEDNDNV